MIYDDVQVFGKMIRFVGNKKPAHPQDGDLVILDGGDHEVFMHGKWLGISPMPIDAALQREQKASENCKSCGALIHDGKCRYCGRRT